jgi:hypothetical protein
MQTERVTFLTTPDHKRALDAFAAENGRSVGHVVREATASYIALPRADDAEAERELALLLPQAEAAMAAMLDDIAAMRAVIADTRAAVDAALKGDGPSA